MNSRLSALLSTISNSFCDFTLDVAVNKFNMYKVLLVTSILASIGQLIAGLTLGVEVRYESIPIILIYGIFMLCGYMCYVKSLKKLPIGLTGLIESGILFIVLIVDIILGYLKLTPYFVIMFTLFMGAIFVFSYETNKLKDEVKLKKVNLNGIFILLLGMFFYACEPYLIKIASRTGANEIAINLGYYIFAIPYFFVKYKSSQKSVVPISTNSKQKRNFIILCMMIGVFEVFYYLLGTMSFINDTPVIVSIIQECRVFLLIILSVIFGTDKMNIKKFIAMLLGISAVIGIYLS